MIKRKKVYIYERDKILYFEEYLRVHDNIVDLSAVPLPKLDRLYCRYQCECARLGVAYVAPNVYGVKGLFG